MNGNMIPIAAEQFAALPQTAVKTAKPAADDKSGFFAVFTSAVQATENVSGQPGQANTAAGSEKQPETADSATNAATLFPALAIMPQFTAINDSGLAVARQLNEAAGIDVVALSSAGSQTATLPPTVNAAPNPGPAASGLGPQAELPAIGSPAAAVITRPDLAGPQTKPADSGAGINQPPDAAPQPTAGLREAPLPLDQAPIVPQVKQSITQPDGLAVPADKLKASATTVANAPPDMPLPLYGQANPTNAAPVVDELNSLLGVQVQATIKPAGQQNQENTLMQDGEQSFSPASVTSMPVIEDPADIAKTAGQDSQTGDPTPFTAVPDQQKPFFVATGPATPETGAAKPADPYNIAGQIVDQAKLITTSHNSEMIIKLKPDHLGELTLKIVVENGLVNASFHSANAEVRGVIENSLAQLRQDIANQGLKVNYVGVYASLDQFHPRDQRGNHQQQTFKVKTKRGDGQDFAAAVDAISTSGPYASASGVDYRI